MVFSFCLSLLNGTWSDYPSGHDALGHLSKIQYVIKFWPHIDWAYIWYGGIPLFRWYGPLPEILAALTSLTTKCSVQFAITVVFFVGVTLCGIMVYGCVKEYTGKRFESILASMLTLSSSILWGWGIIGGMYTRITALFFFSASLFFLSKYVKDRLNGKDRRGLYLLFAICVSMTVISHPLIGFAAGLSLAVLVMSTLRRDGLRSTLALYAKISLPIILLSAWFILPFLAGTPGAVTTDNPFSLSVFEKRKTQLFPLNDFLFLLTRIPISYTPSHLLRYTFSPAIMPVFLLILFAWAKKRSKLSLDESNLIRGLILCSIFFLAYVSLGADNSYLMMLIFFIPIASGILLGSILHKVRSFQVGCFSKILLVVVLLMSIFVQYPLTSFSVSTWKRDIKNGYSYPEVQQILSNESDERNYRFGVPSDAVGSWFNYEYDIPQTRGYYAQGVLQPKWIFWLESFAWGNASSLESDFLLDWFAVKWFIVYPPYNDTKFLAAQDLFREIVDRKPIYGFVRRNASSIVSANTIPTLLIIGKAVESYEVIIRSFSYSDYNSLRIVPIRGSEYVDDYTLEELKRFDVVMLYGFNYHDRGRSYKILEEYVRQGGGLLIESGYSPETSSPDIPLPCPVKKTEPGSAHFEWHLVPINSSITDNVDFSLFSPALYGSSPWGIVTSTNESVRAGAQTLIWFNGRPLVVVSEYGNGRVIWSGLNLPFHITSYKNAIESTLLGNMLNWVSNPETRRQTNVRFEVVRENPGRVHVIVNESASGILFKEFYFENWRAYVMDSEERKQSLQILRTGLDFMYVFLDKRFAYPVRVTFEYEKTPLEYASFSITAITAVVLALYTFRPNVFMRIASVCLAPVGWLRKKLKGIAWRVREWWLRE